MTANPLLSHPQQRLSKVLKEAGGVSVRSALLDAKREVGLLKNDVRKELEKRLVDVNAAHATVTAYETPENIQALYDTTNRMVGLGAYGGAPHFDTAAICLCILLDKMQRYAGYDAQAVSVHINAFPLIFRADPAAADRIVEGLKKIGQGRKFIESEDAPTN